MRIRTIKPSFFLNDTLASCSPHARLLFIGLWCAADCAGRLEERPKRLKAELMPYDDVSVEMLLSELDASGFITRYDGDGVKLIQVVNFSKHQRITGSEAESKSVFPSPKKQETMTVSRMETPNVPTLETPNVAMLDDRKEGRKEGNGKEGNKTIPPSGGGQIGFQIIGDLEQKPKPANPEHSNFIAKWCESFKKHHNGRNYIFNGGRDGKAVQRLLATGKSTDELIKIAVAAWAKPGIWECDKAVDIHGFAANINAIIEKVEYRPPAKVDVDSPEYRAAYEASLTPTV